MSADLIYFGNKTKKEYIQPQTSAKYLVDDWFVSRVALYLIAEPHALDLPKGEVSESLYGSWVGSECFWISDYDEIWQDREQFENEWKDITSQCIVMLYEQGEHNIKNLIYDIEKSPEALLIIGKAVEETRMLKLESELELILGKNWRNWYYYAIENRHNRITNWPNIKFR